MKYTKDELIEYAKQHRTGFGIDSAIAIEFLSMVDQISEAKETLQYISSAYDGRIEVLANETLAKLN